MLVAARVHVFLKDCTHFGSSKPTKFSCLAGRTVTDLELGGVETTQKRPKTELELWPLANHKSSGVEKKDDLP